MDYDTTEVSYPSSKSSRSSRSDDEVVFDMDYPPALKCKMVWPVWHHRNLKESHRHLKGKSGPTVTVIEHKLFDFECGCIHGDENRCPTEELSNHTVIMKDCDSIEGDSATWVPLPSFNDTFMFENLQSGRCMEINWYEESIVTNPCDISNKNQRFTEPNPEAFYLFPPT